MINRYIKNLKNSNKGSTLVEMIVCFALLGIFLASATSVIVMIANLYYEVKGETYSEQVSDILLEKISSEIDGAEYISGDLTSIPVIDGSDSNNYGSSFSLIDKTGTKVKLYKDSSNRFAIDYDKIVDTINPDNNREATTWKFDDNVYNGFVLKDLIFIRGDGLSAHSDVVSDYGINSNLTNYKNNVILVLLTLDSAKYGEYKEYRFVKMYYVPENYVTGVAD